MNILQSHLLFADDTLIFCEANSEQLRNFVLSLFMFPSSVLVGVGD
jgi:hypothetical protein